MNPDYDHDNYFMLNRGVHYSLRGGGGGGGESSSFSSWNSNSTSMELWRMSSATSPPALRRHLSESRGQAVLTFMYLCVLGLCFTTAVIYFCRMQWEERYLRRLRDFERHQIRSAMAQSENTQREESRAVQRKYIEERRARILQLFAPVRLSLEPENFCDKEATTGGNKKNDVKEDSSDEKNKVSKGEEREETKNQEESENSTPTNNNKASADGIAKSAKEGSNSENKNAAAPAGGETSENAYGEEDSLMVEIPAPGLHLRLGVNEKPPTRWASGMCTICLCTFEIGSDVVWSSNELCEHVFHESCIEKWLMKQREGPLCPCCRRDFIVDPYDMENNNEQGDNSNNDPHDVGDVEASVAVVGTEATRPTSVQAVFSNNPSE